MRLPFLIVLLIVGSALAIFLLSLLLAWATPAPETELRNPGNNCWLRDDFLVVLPDGTTLSASGLTYHLDVRVIEISGDDRIFCSSFEDAELPAV